MIEDWKLKIDNNAYYISKQFLENIDVWVHEFTETGVWDAIENLGGRVRWITFSPDYSISLAHLVTSCHCISGWKNKLINSDEFVKRICPMIVDTKER